MNKKKEDNIEKEYWEEVELTDPTTGKVFKQKVKITKYKAQDKDIKSISEELDEVAPLPLDEDDIDQE
jgi:hypothetical protein